MKKDTIATLWVVLGLFFLFFSGHPPLYASDLVACGSQNLHIYFENVPADWPEYQRNCDHMYLWNQYMDIYRYGPGTPTWGGDNGVNEFGGYPSDADLNDQCGGHWSPEGAARCCLWRTWWPPWDDCRRIDETDIVFNPTVSWTFNRDYAEDNPGVVFYDAALLHELGHSWGLQTINDDGKFAYPTVMMGYSTGIVQDSLLIHALDAHLLRKNYSGQESIPWIRDMGVHSKYADGTTLSWANSTPDKYVYVAGESITINNLTVENTSYFDVSYPHLRLYLSRDRYFDSADTLIGDWYWDSFPAERYGLFDFTATIPSWLAPGPYYVVALVTYDGYNSFDWFDNQTHLYNKIIVRPPDVIDLIVESISTSPPPPYGPYVGEPVNVTVTVRNQGNVKVGAFYVDFYKNRASAPVPYQGGDFNCIIYVLEGGTKATCTNTVTYDAAGTYNMWAQVDSQRQVAESNENNNVFGPQIINVGKRGTLSVTPSNGLTSSGNQGGPFSPSSTMYTLQNTGNISINWTAFKAQTWTTLSSTSGTLAAGASTTVTVSINSNANGLASGSYSDTVYFTNTTNGNGNTSRPVSLTVNMTFIEALSVTPLSGLTSSGNQGGPFSPSSTMYTLQNAGNSSINWTASKAQTWTTLSSTSGTLAAGASTTVTVSINSNANVLASGSYSDTVSFTNTTNGSGNTTRPVNLTITGAPPSTTITLKSPNGGENWAAGTTQTISWTYTGNPGSYVKIQLFKGGVLNRTISSTCSIGTAGSGSRSWAIPSTQTAGSDYQVKVTSTTNSACTDTSNANFTITGPPPPSITVTSPNGGETWAAGTTQTIRWTYAGSPGSYVKIELFKSGVLNRTIISSRSYGSGGSGSYPWAIPSTQTAGSDYQVRVTSTTNSACTDTSNANFTITGPSPPSITVVTPNGGENWAAGTTQMIQWSYTGSPGSYVKIELFKGGVLNRTIISSRSYGSGGNGSYPWAIPSTQTVGSDYQVKVTSTTNSACTDTSNANFTITGPPPPSITVTSPNGGESWAAGSTQTIQWSYTGSPGSYVKIELFKGGVLNRTISSSSSTGTAGSGSYLWPIAATQAGGSDYQVKVTSTTNSAYTDTSNANFTIAGPVAPSITVVTPNGGETWAAGSAQTIQWTYTGDPGAYVKIQLFKGGVLNRTISSSRSIGSAGSGSHSWSILSTQPGGSDYQIKITSTTNSAYADTSDATFTITGP